MSFVSPAFASVLQRSDDPDLRLPSTSIFLFRLRRKLSQLVRISTGSDIRHPAVPPTLLVIPTSAAIAPPASNTEVISPLSAVRSASGSLPPSAVSRENVLHNTPLPPVTAQHVLNNKAVPSIASHCEAFDHLALPAADAVIEAPPASSASRDVPLDDTPSQPPMAAESPRNSITRQRRPLFRRASRPGVASGVFETARHQLLSMTPEYRDSDVTLPTITGAASTDANSQRSVPRGLVPSPATSIAAPAPPTRRVLSAVPEEVDEEVVDAEVAHALDTSVVLSQADVPKLYQSFPPLHHRQHSTQSKSPVAVVKPLSAPATSIGAVSSASAAEIPRRSAATPSPLPATRSANASPSLDSAPTQARPAMTPPSLISVYRGSSASPAAVSISTPTPNPPSVSNGDQPNRSQGTMQTKVDLQLSVA